MEATELLMRLRERFSGQDTTGFNITDFLHRFGSPLDALWYGSLIWPELVEFREMVFLKDAVEDSNDRDRIEQALEHFQHDRMQVERSFNLTELPELFGAHSADLDGSGYDALRDMLLVTWRARLREVFPDREFVVAALTEDQVPGCALTFFERRELTT